MDTASFYYLLALVVHLSLDIYLLGLITTYLYGTLDTEFYITLPHDFISAIPSTKPGKYSGLKILKVLYGLKQAGQMWYHHLINFLIFKGSTYNIALHAYSQYATQHVSSLSQFMSMI